MQLQSKQIFFFAQFHLVGLTKMEAIAKKDVAFPDKVILKKSL